jgi:hypothetical protein
MEAYHNPCDRQHAWLVGMFIATNENAEIMYLYLARLTTENAPQKL